MHAVGDSSDVTSSVALHLSLDLGARFPWEVKLDLTNEKQTGLFPAVLGLVLFCWKSKVTVATPMNSR